MRLTALTIVLIMAASAARAGDADQWTFGGVQPDESAWSFTPTRLPIARSHIDHYATLLALDAGQQEALATLLESVASQYRLAWVAHAERVADLSARVRVSQSWQTQQAERADLSERFRAEREQFVDSLFEDLRLFLTPEQDARWNMVERDRRRVTTLVQYACFDDESVDLVSAVGALNISDDQRAALAPILERYAESIDPVLAARNRKSSALADNAREHQRLQASAYSPSSDGDPQEMIKAQQRLQEMQIAIVPAALEVRQASMRVRDVNRQFMDELTKAIPASATDDWKKATKPGKRARNPWESYSRADMLLKTLENLDQMINMAETQMQMWDTDQDNEYILLVRAVEPLTPDQRSRVEAIHEEFTSARARLERELKPTAQDDEERTLSIPTTAGTVTVYRNDQEAANANPFAFYNRKQQDPEFAARCAELEQDAIDRVRGILSVNQRAMVAHY